MPKIAREREREQERTMAPPNITTVFDETGNQRTDNIIHDEDLQQQDQPQHQHYQRKQQLDWEGPPSQGLYDPLNEHEACGVGFIVAIDGKRSHKVINYILPTPRIP